MCLRGSAGCVSARDERDFSWGPRLLGGVVLAAALVGGVAHAQPAPAGAAAPAGASVPAKPSDAPLPSCLDQTIASQVGETLKPRGVQKRNFLKRGHVALVAHGGLYGGDLTSSAWIAGGSLGFFFTQDFRGIGRFD